MAMDEESAAKRRKKCDDIAQKLGINASEVPAAFVEHLPKNAPKPEEEHSSSEEVKDKDDVVYIFDENEPLTEGNTGPNGEKLVWGKLPGNVITESRGGTVTTLHSSNLAFVEKEAKRARRLFTTMRGGGTQIVGLNWEKATVILPSDTPLKQLVGADDLQDL